MSSLNKKIKYPTIFTENGGKAVKINYVQQLRRTVMSCMLWENNFYESGVSVADRIKDLVKHIDPEIVIEVAIEAKHTMKLRHVPLYLISLLSENGYPIRKIVPQVVNRLDDLGELLAIYRRDDSKKKFTRGLLRGIADCFSKFNEYQFSKYKGSKKEYNIFDIINLTHPKPKNDIEKELFKKIVTDTLSTPNTWEVRYSACKTTEEKRAVWQDLLDNKQLGGLATLRNLRNMETVGYDGISKAISQIQDPKLLPINFIKAYDITPQFEYDLERKFIELFSNKEKLYGKTLLLVDVSGSMLGSEEKNAGGLAMIAREKFDDLEVRIFGDERNKYITYEGFIESVNIILETIV
jgi:hypothetical protein